MTAQETPWRTRIVGHDVVKPAELVPNPENWRAHPQAQRDALGGALDEVGWVTEVIVNRNTGRLVDGHLRLDLALSRDEAFVPVTYVDLSEDEERLVLATLDPLAAMADAEVIPLAELLGHLSPESLALRGMLDDLAKQYGTERRPELTDPDDVPDVPDVHDVYVQSGEMYQLGDHRLMCGDSTDASDVGRLLDGVEPLLLVTDPPYGVSLDPRWRDGLYNEMGPAEEPYMRIEGHKNTTLSGDTRADWADAFALVPSLEVGYVWHADRYSVLVLEGLTRIGFELVCQVVWDKGLFAMGRSWYHWRHEPCWVVRKPGVPNLFVGERNQSTVWEAPSPKMIMSGSKEEKFDHPAQKPVAVIEPSIRNHVGDIYDPFVGSGTTIIAAEQHSRRCYAMEIDPRYAQVAIKRWEAFTGRSAVLIDA